MQKLPKYEQLKVAINIARYVLTFIFALAAAVYLWSELIEAHPMFTRVGPTCLIPPIVASLLAGIIAAIGSPRHKVRMAMFVGLTLTLPFLMLLLNGKMALLGRNPFYWYWGAYIVPATLVGEFVVRKVSNMYWKIQPLQKCLSVTTWISRKQRKKRM